jgi:CheY-like chemotaxis protein
MMSCKNKILLVDDRPENLLSLSAMLEDPALTIIAAHSGNEALSLLLRHEITLVFLDVQMPEMDGFEVAELMRANRRTCDVPIILITALSRDLGHIFRGYEAGAVDYILKPIQNPMILRSKVDVFCRLHNQKRRITEQFDEIATKNRLLEQQLKEIKTLRGIIPICMSCKRIRDDQGYWDHVEHYLRTHSEAEFSHGYCPECGEKAMAKVEGELYGGRPGSEAAESEEETKK